MSIHDVRNDPVSALAGPEELPVTLALNDVDYATSLVTPTALKEWAIGFCYTEGLIDQVAQVTHIDRQPLRHGWLLRLQVEDRISGLALEQRRVGTSMSSCGRCGSASESSMMQGLQQLPMKPLVSEAMLAMALERITRERMPGMHTAMGFFSSDPLDRVLHGHDIGRHNALDKLIGSFLIDGLEPPSLVVISSRCSLELVQKIVRAGVTALATLAVPSSLAVETARLCGLQLFYCHRGTQIDLLSGNIATGDTQISLK